MKTYEILDKGKQILQTDINLYKDYYQQFHDQIKSQNDLDSSIEFELQYLKYMMYVEDNYKEVIQEAQRLATLPNITVYTLSKVNRTLGVAFYHIGEYKQAMESYIESVKLLNNIVLKNDTQCYELGLSYYNISLLYKNEASTNEFDLDKRLEYIKKAEAIFLEIKSNRGLGLIYTGLANYYSNIKNYKLALRYQFKSVDFKTIEKDYIGLSVNYGNISSIYMNFNKLDKAEYYLLKSKELKLSQANNYSTCILYIQLGNFYAAKEDYNQAIENFNTALALAEKYELKFEESSILTELANVYEKIGNYKSAFEYMRRKLIIQESQLDLNKSKALLELKYKYELEKQAGDAQLLQQKNAEIQEYVTKLKNSNYELRQFGQIASHDLKEPIRLIKLHLTKFEKTLGDLDSSQEYLINFIKKTTDSLYNLVNELHKYTNIDQQVKINESINLTEELEDAMENVRHTLGEKDIQINIENIPAQITGNRSQYNQLFFQLIENAFLFNHSEKKNVSISYHQHPTHHVFHVTDNGIGIDDAFATKIFEMFERLHDNSKYAGTGIGLAIVKKIINEMKGYIELESKLGKGSTFKLYINK